MCPPNLGPETYSFPQNLHACVMHQHYSELRRKDSNLNDRVNSTTSCQLNDTGMMFRNDHLSLERMKPHCETAAQLGLPPRTDPLWKRAALVIELPGNKRNTSCQGSVSVQRLNAASVGKQGVEPCEPKRLIYSQPRLRSGLHPQILTLISF